MHLDNLEESKKLYEKAIQVNKKYHPSFNNLGLYYDKIGEKKTAFEHYKKCLDIDPDYPNALNNIGRSYCFFENSAEAFKCFFKAIKIDPNMIDLYFNIGHAYFEIRDFKEAEIWFKKGFKMDPNNLIGHYNYSFMLLALQKYGRAWEEFDYRLKKLTKLNENFLYNKIKNKIWNNQDLKGKNMLIVREQGAGDEILYSSMYNELISEYPNVKIEVDPRLYNIFKRSNNAENFISANKISQDEKELKNIDHIIFAGSLGRIYRLNKSQFPKRKNFLITDTDLSKKIKKRLDNINNKPKIGISWFSGNKRIGEGKSMKLYSLLPILELENLSFVNLQYGNHDKEIKDFKNKTNINIIDLKDIDKYDDFDSLAALIESLDLLITVSNTTAHLAGAIGKETWVMAPKNDSLLYYWNTGQKTTPWYPSVTIYSKINKWEETINNIRFDLINHFKKN
tara:strand:- start:253 stop:1608 length:1356 start_codon:yes stop_codon:yes gene_type:complete